MFVAGAAPKGSLFGTGKEEFKPKPVNLEFSSGGEVAVTGNGPPETEVATAGPGPKLKVLDDFLSHYCPIDLGS